MCIRLLLLYVVSSMYYLGSIQHHDFFLDYNNFRKVSSNFFWCTYSCGQHQTHLRKVYTKFWPSLHKLQSFQKVLKSFLKSVNSKATVKKIFLYIQDKAILLSMFEICRNFSWKCKCIKIKTYFKNWNYKLCCISTLHLIQKMMVEINFWTISLCLLKKS